MKSSSSLTILEAMEDPKLFRPWFKTDSWDAWKAFLVALFGLPMTDAQLAIYRSCTGRTKAPTIPFSEVWVCCGRRAGKSLIAALLAVYFACFRDDYAQYLAPGERVTLMAVAADRKQARTIFRYVHGFLTEVPLLKQGITREMKESIELGRVVAEVHTQSYKSVRGYTSALCLNDESAFWSSEDSADPASETIRAQRPMLATIPRSLLANFSSPHASRGPMFDAFRDHYGHDDSPVLFWKASSLVMNPKLDRRVVDEAYRLDPVAAAAEFGAEFRTDCESFVSREAVEACVIRERRELPRVEDISYSAFVDPSGGSSDDMTLAIAHCGSNGRAVLDCLRERKPPFSPEDCVREFAGVLRSYGISEVTGDAYAGEWPRERFRTYGISYRCAEQSRSEIYLELLPLVNSRRCELLEHSKLLNQLTGLERHASASGRETIDHRPGTHDDVANCAAGALITALRVAVSAERVLAVLVTNGQTFDFGRSSRPGEYVVAQKSKPQMIPPDSPKFWKPHGHF